MGGRTGIVSGVALVAFAIGALLVAVGDRRRGARAICFALALAAVDPLLEAGIARLERAESLRGRSLAPIIVALMSLAIVLAGLVALRRTRGARAAEATSQKRRVERAP